jgi:hypothetical protein
MPRFSAVTIVLLLAVFAFPFGNCNDADIILEWRSFVSTSLRNVFSVRTPLRDFYGQAFYFADLLPFPSVKQAFV